MGAATTKKPSRCWPTLNVRLPKLGNLCNCKTTTLTTKKNKLKKKAKKKNKVKKKKKLKKLKKKLKKRNKNKSKKKKKNLNNKQLHFCLLPKLVNCKTWALPTATVTPLSCKNTRAMCSQLCKNCWPIIK